MTEKKINLNRFLIQWFLLLFTVCMILSSCSNEKRIARAVKRHGAKETVAFLAVNYPEYLTTDTVRTTIEKEVKVEVKVPEIKYDTIIKHDTINDCRTFVYSDKNLAVNVATINGKLKVNYKIKERLVKDTVRIVEHIALPCPPCPTVAIVQSVKDTYEGALMKQVGRKKFYRNGFWILLLIIVSYIALKVLKKMYFPNIPIN